MPNLYSRILCNCSRSLGFLLKKTKIIIFDLSYLFIFYDSLFKLLNIDYFDRYTRKTITCLMLQNFNVNLEDLEEETQHRYQFTHMLGRGAYGIVLAAIEKATGREVAVKRVERIFESVLDSKRILREIRILQHLKHQNINELLDVSALPNYEKFHALILVTDLMDTDMYRIVNSDQQLLVDHHRYFIYQLLRGLKYIHTAKILHRDLKPSNLLLNANCDLKICDFGLARVCLDQSDNPDNFLTEYVATRWYRAPEVLLNYETYGPPIDVWSVGCIMAELIARKPLFPGKSTMHQLKIITEKIGSPTEDDLKDCTNPKAREFMNSLEHHDKVSMSEIFPGEDPAELDLMERMLTWDPTKRITVEEALEHPFLEPLHDPFDEPIAFPISPFTFDRPDITMAELKQEMWKDVLKFHPDFPPAQ